MAIKRITQLPLDNDVTGPDVLPVVSDGATKRVTLTTLKAFFAAAGPTGPAGSPGANGTAGAAGPAGPTGPATPLFTVLSDTVSNVSYLGLAASGSSTAASVWRIKQTTISSAGAVASSLTASSVAWNDRLTASYS